jgi:transcriptional regulator
MAPIEDSIEGSRAVSRKQGIRKAIRPAGLLRNNPEAKQTESQTLRRHIIALLRGQAQDVRALSQALRVQEKEVCAHLAHVERSVAAAGDRFIVTPSQCLLCGYVFEDRRKLTRPSRCPKCKRSKLQSPSFRIVAPTQSSTNGSF